MWGRNSTKKEKGDFRPQQAFEVVSMDVLRIVRRLQKKFHSLQDKLAVTILIWLEKEPSQDRVLSAAATGDCSGAYIRYRERSRPKASVRTSDQLKEKEKLA
jgi:hypothetical protein